MGRSPTGTRPETTGAVFRFLVLAGSFGRRPGSFFRNGLLAGRHRHFQIRGHGVVARICLHVGGDLFGVPHLAESLDPCLLIPLVGVGEFVEGALDCALLSTLGLVVEKDLARFIDHLGEKVGDEPLGVVLQLLPDLVVGEFRHVLVGEQRLIVVAFSTFFLSALVVPFSEDFELRLCSDTGFAFFVPFLDDPLPCRVLVETGFVAFALFAVFTGVFVGALCAFAAILDINGVDDVLGVAAVLRLIGG